jgi:hypothetical protein
MSEKMLAACGLDCYACRAYIATKENDYSKLVETAKLWSEPEMEFKPEDIPCDGCNTERLHAFCRRCPVRICAKSRGIMICGDCSEYKCSKLESLWKWLSASSGVAARANMEEYRKKRGS